MGISGPLGRRQFLSIAAEGGAWLLVLENRVGRRVALQTDAGATQLSSPNGRQLGTVPLDLPAAGRVPLERILDEGLDARLFTDLSKLTAENLVTRNDSFFVRTASPRQLPPVDTWSIAVGGLVREPLRVALSTLERDVRPAGVHLAECSGNTAPTFGLLSAADWDGVPLSTVLARIQRLPAATHVTVSGIDDRDGRSSSSIPGASWIFALDDLERAGAFLATRMNHQPLTRDHGGPVRLVVPGWYGCTWIKWIDEIALVDSDTAVTSQMREFATRTHQRGMPPRASDFLPATIDTAAMPVRIEKWLIDGRIAYRVIGIVWGGSKPTNELVIRFKANQPFVPVSDCPLPSSTSTWSLWSHLWRPQETGRYQILLRVNDPAVSTRRLDLYFYIREVSIDEA